VNLNVTARGPIVSVLEFEGKVECCQVGAAKCRLPSADRLPSALEVMTHVLHKGGSTGNAAVGHSLRVVIMM
jgi:hypothetical protein